MPLQVKKVQLKVKDGNQYVDGDMLFNVDAEAWATGKRNGVPVSSSDQTYQNNAKYYSTILQPPSQNGTYVLKVTVNGDSITYNWVLE